MSGLGWVRDEPDIRDHVALRDEEIVDAAALPATFSLRPEMPPVLDQGDLGSCTAHGTTTAVRFDRIAQKLPDVDLSRLFVYYQTRLMEGDVSQDAGGQVRDAIKSINLYGVPVESDWPYVESRFAQKPPAKAYTDGKLNLSLSYARVTHSAAAVKTMLAVKKRPVVFGFTCYAGLQSQDTAESGILPLPSGASIGGHCTAVEGWTNDLPSVLKGAPAATAGTDFYEIRNSWGEDWGDAGNFWMPAKYFLNASLVSDLWSIQSVEQNAA